MTTFRERLIVALIEHDGLDGITAFDGADGPAKVKLIATRCCESWGHDWIERTVVGLQSGATYNVVTCARCGKERETEVQTESSGQCKDMTPPGWVGRWRDWHRGHGCELDDGKPRTADICKTCGVPEKHHAEARRAGEIVCRAFVR